MCLTRLFFKNAHREGANGGSMTRARLTLVLFLGAMSALAQTRTPKLIDVHMHYDGEPGVLDKVLVKLERADGIAFLLTTPKGFPQANKFIQEHSDRFIGFGDIKLDDPDVLHQIDRFHAAGFRGLGEISMTRKAYDDPAYWPIYDRANKYHMILLFHTGIVNRLHPQEPADISFERSRVTRLDLIARHWPNLIIIGAHLGNPDYEEAGEVDDGTPISTSMLRVRLSSRRRPTIVFSSPSSGGPRSPVPIRRSAAPVLLRNLFLARMSAVESWTSSIVRSRATTPCWMIV